MIEIRTVLCPVDVSPLSERALELAVSVARKVGARLVLEHNLDSRPPGYLGVSWMWSQEHETEERAKADRGDQHVRELLARVPAELRPEARVTRGPIADALLHLTRDLPADLMVMGTHGPSSAEHRSLTESIIQHSPCPVLTLGEGYEPESVMGALEGQAPEEMSVLVPVDFSAGSRSALAFGAALAERMPHRLVLIHVLAKPADEAARAEAVRRLDELVPSELAHRVSAEVRTGDTVSELLAAAQQHGALFVLMGVKGKGVLQRLLFGSTTLGLLGKCECPVLFLPPGMARVGGE